ncbi:hypothetical protein EB796_004296 [Bugula neritina]|uniref:Uncharacterized protein n=1 Tax=Bugula neritina TaxID=10212 RepID=A0A7J7KFE9_BUGNE|nr:hypothetical protein EB796_004296 [Bugula neritina]
MKTWYPGMNDDEEMSDTECIDFVSMSPYVSDIEGDNRVSREENRDSISSSTHTPTPSTSGMVIKHKKKSMSNTHMQPV